MFLYISPPYFFFPKANEADQKAAQVAQDEVSKKSNVCGIPLFVELAKPHLTPLTLIARFPPCRGSSGLRWGLTVSGFHVYAPAG